MHAYFYKDTSMAYHMKFQGLQQKLSLGVLKMIYDDENLQPCRLGIFWMGRSSKKITWVFAQVPLANLHVG